MPHLEWRPVSIGGDPRQPAFATSIHASEAERLGKLAAGRRCLEIGSAYGYSAVIMALGGAEHVTAVDHHAWLPTLGVMTANLAAFGVTGKVTMIVEDSADALRGLAAGGKRFGLIFIDGDHRQEAVTEDIDLALAVLEPGGILACHDFGEDFTPDVGNVLNGRFPDGPDELTVTLWQKAVA